MFKLNPPTNRAYLISLGIAAAAVVARFFIYIPYVSEYIFEILLVAYGLLALACLFKNL
ncbi:MAG: hypothetical protein GX061_03380 [Eubacteriaceae bacterium]|nr:hypothetical protein [Eubacteriaceae bacterium]